jgi:hypothetical protein
VTVERDAPPEPRRRKKKRRPLEVPAWLAVIPAVLFACGGVLLIGLGGVMLWAMIYYNATAGEIVRTHPDRRLWDQVTLSPQNFVMVLWLFGNGTAALFVCWSWLFNESQRAFKLSLAMIGFLVVSPSLIKFAGLAGGSHPSTRDAPVVARRQAMPLQASVGQPPAVPAPPAAVDAGGPSAGPSGSFLQTIFLDRMTEAERTRNEQLLRKEFLSLRHYVPDSLRIEANTLMWKSTVSFFDRERNKGEAIAILRRNNIRLSQFSEQWLKSDLGKRTIPGGAAP